MSWPPLRDDLLYLMVFGPGFGEAVVLRIPGGHWVLIDSCTIEGRCPSLQVLDLEEGAWSYAFLTHPHFDHIRGFDRILDRQPAGVVGCADPRVLDWRKWSDSPDAEELLERGLLEQVMATIHTRWSGDAASRWLLRRGDCRTIGSERS
jgi:glyoxylase-like metal-dependent hydrolase (beta-lactamase superfamily II)